MQTDAALIEAVRRMVRQKLTARQIGEQLGLSRQRVSNLVRIANKAPAQWIRRVESGALTWKHLEAVLTLPGDEAERLLGDSIAERWSAAKLRTEVARAKGHAPASDPSMDPDVADLEDKVGQLLATRVRVRTGKDGRSGELALWFADLETLDGLLERLGYRRD